MSAKNKVTPPASTKMKMSDLRAGPAKVELIHPLNGNTGIYLTLRTPYSPEVKAALKVFMDSEKEAIDNARVLSAYIKEWDEEAFELPLTEDNVIAFFTDDDNAWVIVALNHLLESPTTYFKKK